MSSAAPSSNSGITGPSLLAAAIGAACVAAWVWATGGVRLVLLGTSVSARSAGPVAVVSALLFVAWSVLRRSHLRDDVSRLRSVVDRREPWFALAVTTFVLLTGIAFGSTVAARRGLVRLPESSRALAPRPIGSRRTDWRRPHARQRLGVRPSRLSARAHTGHARSQLPSGPPPAVRARRVGHSCGRRARRTGAGGRGRLARVRACTRQCRTRGRTGRVHAARLLARVPLPARSAHVGRARHRVVAGVNRGADDRAARPSVTRRLVRRRGCRHTAKPRTCPARAAAPARRTARAAARPRTRRGFARPLFTAPPIASVGDDHSKVCVVRRRPPASRRVARVVQHHAVRGAVGLRVR